MNKKVDPEMVRQAFLEAGLITLEPYRKAKIPIPFRCVNGHTHQLAWDKFKSGVRCAYCAQRIVTFEQVKAAFEAEGYELLETKYVKAHAPLRYRCPDKHESSMPWTNFSSGNRCPYCAGKIVKPEDVERSFAEAGYKMLSPYNGHKGYIKYQCDNNHIHQIRWHNWLSGHRCPYCASSIVTHDQVKSALEAEGYQLLSQYKKNTQRLRIVCKAGHQHTIAWADWRDGSRCGKCAGKHRTTEDAIALFEKRGYTLLDEYKGADAAVRFICPIGHYSTVIFHVFQKGGGCKVCAGIEPCTPEQKALNKIKLRVNTDIRRKIKKRGIKNPGFSKSSLAGRIAKNIQEHMGERPPGCHIDHIIPISFFDFTKIEEIEACWSVENLRWLNSSENCSRQNRMTAEELDNLTPKQKKILKIASMKPDYVIQYLELKAKGFTQIQLPLDI